jgi:hypothetical protein
VDVEGAESKVLEGCQRIARQGRTRFLVEMHSNDELAMTENARLILAWCEQLDYAAWYLKIHEELTTPEQLQDRGRCHLLLQPAGWDYPDWLKGIEQGASLRNVKTAIAGTRVR